MRRRTRGVAMVVMGVVVIVVSLVNVAGGRSREHNLADHVRSEIAELREKGATSGDERLIFLRDLLGDISSSDVPRRAGRPRPVEHRPVDWDRGKVLCEPIPGGVLSAAEVANAICLGAPLGDGSTRYVVLDPDGTVRVVRFDVGRSPRRLADRRIEPGIAASPGAEYDVGPDGRIAIRHGRASTILDVRH